MEKNYSSRYMEVLQQNRHKVDQAVSAFHTHANEINNKAVKVAIEKEAKVLYMHHAAYRST